MTKVTYGKWFDVKEKSFDIASVVNGEIVFKVHPDKNVMRLLIMKLKDNLITQAEHVVELETEHIINDGTYTRKLHIPKGTILVGKIHKLSCVNIVAKGDITVMTVNGVARALAGDTAISEIGTQKVGFAHEDTIFLNVFRTDKTTIEEIENEIACESYDFLALPQEKQGALLCQ